VRTLPGARVFEAKDHPGGHVYSHAVDGAFFDEGAHISHTKRPEFLKLIYEQAGDVHQIEPSIVSNYWHSLWLTYPVQNHLYELPLAKRIPALAHFVIAHITRRRDEANYAEWCRNEYGKYLSEHFYKEFTEKYWRIPMEQLATDWLGGRLIPSVTMNIIRGAFSPRIERQASFAKFHYPARGGFFGFFKPLFDDVRIHCNQRAMEIEANAKWVVFNSGRKEHYEVLASTIPLPELVSIIKDAPPSVRDAAALLRHTKLLCVNLVIRRENLVKCHWCYIYDNDIEPARVSFPSNLSPASMKGGISTLQAEVFRRNDEEWDIDSLTENTVKQMANLFGFDAKSDLVSATPIVVPYAYVISDLNRKASVAHIRSWLRERDIFCMGLYGKWRYLWSDEAFASGVETANQIRERLC